jgi:hypothetical protein
MNKILEEEIEKATEDVIGRIKNREIDQNAYPIKAYPIFENSRIESFVISRGMKPYGHYYYPISGNKPLLVYNGDYGVIEVRKDFVTNFLSYKADRHEMMLGLIIGHEYSHHKFWKAILEKIYQEMIEKFKSKFSALDKISILHGEIRHLNEELAFEVQLRMLLDFYRERRYQTREILSVASFLFNIFAELYRGKNEYYVKALNDLLGLDSNGNMIFAKFLEFLKNCKNYEEAKCPLEELILMLEEKRDSIIQLSKEILNHRKEEIISGVERKY